MPTPYLSKSRYLAARQCEKRLWLSVHRPELAREIDAGTRSIIDAGHRIGFAAHALVPGGVLVEESSADFPAAVAKTNALLEDPDIPAIFEAAFEHDGVRVRADIVERTGAATFGLREVKSSTREKDAHEPDLAIQLWVLRGCGLDVTSAQVVRINKDFVRREGDIDWTQFFVRLDLTDTVEKTFGRIEEEVPAMHEVLARSDAPVIEPSPHCNKPHTCEFWDHCTAGKSAEWAINAKRTRAGLKARWTEAARSGRPWISESISSTLEPAKPPVWYLDFEALVPAVPIYEGTRPYQALPFQWSLHHLDASGTVRHKEFLAQGDDDPRTATAESLIEALSQDSDRIVVYSSYEGQMLAKMKVHAADISSELEQLRARLFDLLPVVRNLIYHPAFAGSFSIKKVAPALAPHVRYDDLQDVAEGIGAASAFARLATGDIDEAEDAPLRKALLAYCERDTFALMEVHRAMMRMGARGPVPSP